MLYKKIKYVLSKIWTYRYFNRMRVLGFYKERRIKLSLWEKLKLLFFLDSQIMLPFIDIDVTTHCNLKCKRCAKCIPLFQEHKNFLPEEIRESVDLLATYVDYIHVANLIGGEPFLNPDLAEIIHICANNEKINYLEITTNATVLPKEEVFRALKDGGVTVHISNYPKISRQSEIKEKLIKKLEEYQIPYEYQFHSIWLDFGEVTNRNFSKKTMENMMIHCPMNSCTVYNNKKLFRCGKVSYLAQHNIAPGNDEVLDLESIKSKKEMKKKIKDFYSVKYFAACSYCEEHPTAIAAAEQIEEK